MINSLKAKRLESYKEYYNKYGAAIMVKYTAKNVATLNVIKRALHEKSCGIFVVVHNRLLNIALKENNVEENEEFKLKNQLGVIFTDDIITAAKVIMSLKKKLKLEIVGCVNDNKYQNDKHVVTLSKTPDLETQRKILFSLLSHPVRALIHTFKKPAQTLLQVINKQITANNS